MDEGLQSDRMIRLDRIPKAEIITAVITSAVVIAAVIVAATSGLVDMAAFRVPPSGVDQSLEKQIADANCSTELFSGDSDRFPVPGYGLGGKNDNLTMRMAGDLDGDGLIEEYRLENNRLTITENGRTIWQTEEGWSVDSFALGDVTNDGGTELVISLWKVGSFGAIRPFWHDGEDESYKNHLFIYKFKDQVFRPVWCSSDLDNPIISFEIKDIDGDGLNELVVVEGEYLSELGGQSEVGQAGQASQKGQDSQVGRARQDSQDSQSCQCLENLRLADSPQITVWRWDEWGLSRVERDH